MEPELAWLIYPTLFLSFFMSISSSRLFTLLLSFSFVFIFFVLIFVDHPENWHCDYWSVKHSALFYRSFNWHHPDHESGYFFSVCWSVLCLSLDSCKRCLSRYKSRPGQPQMKSHTSTHLLSLSLTTIITYLGLQQLSFSFSYSSCCSALALTWHLEV